jgi:hypothetical protein
MSTRLPIEALEMARLYIKKIPLDGLGVGEAIIRRAMARMWMAAPFSWTIGAGVSFNLVEGVGLYTAVTYPTDWGYALKADYVVGDSLTQTRDLTIVGRIEDDDGQEGQPSKIYYSGPQGLESTVRISPIPQAFDGTPRVTSLYKRTCPVYTGAAIHNTVIPFPDDWFYVFEDIVLYEAYKFADDSRAGEAVIAGDQPKFNGQMAVFQASLGEMRLREPLVLLGEKPREKDPSR